MIDLTEQLYDGTLPTGHYYFNNGVETYIVLYKNINSKHLILQEPEGLTVISGVPSYEEYTKLKEELKDYEYQHKQDGICYDDIFCKLELARKENRQLKERLKKTQELELEVRKENAQLKKWCEEFNALEVAKENTKLKTDCHTLAQTLLKVSPEHKAWLEKNYKEYL